MTPRYFADAWFFIAATNRLDSDHSRAMRLAPHLRNDTVTTEAVLTEMLAFFSRGGPDARLRAATGVRWAMDRLTVVTIDRPLFTRGLHLYERRLDKGFSLTDCLSMLVMEDLGIQHVLTNDHHFAQAGFTLVNE